MYIYYTDKFEGGRERSRELLACALHEYNGTEAPEILEMEGGKPYVDGGPEFSVSHSGNYWAVLIDERQCGLDIQLPRDKARIGAIARKLFSGKEADLVETRGEDFFYRLWTRRESLVKCSGRSVFTDDVPELLVSEGEDVIKVFYDGGYRAVMDLDLPIELYVSMCITVDEEWQTRREVPQMKRLGI